MKKVFFVTTSLLNVVILFAQNSIGTNAPPVPQFFEVTKIQATPVQSQGRTGTCWSFATTSLVESEGIRKAKKEIDLSEMFTVRNTYVEKAKNYILRLGNAQFSEGGLGHDMIRAIGTYGAEPLVIYDGLPAGQKKYDHKELFPQLKLYLDSILRKQPISADWLSGYTKILDDNMGVPPAEFIFEGKKYTPLTFAKEVLNFNADDYISLTSFTHQPYYKPFILQVPDNFANGSFFNLPLDEMIDVVKQAVRKGYSISWDADVSNPGFMQNMALHLGINNAVDDRTSFNADMDINPDVQELPYDATIRQQLYENLTTQDDHLMHITGIERSKEGKTFFIVKNSWGKAGAFEGYINVSESYFAINTISIVVPKAALSTELMTKLGIK